MALSPNEKWILVAVFSVVGLAVMYFEIRYMRSKGKEVREANQRGDEAHNAILTTRSVINVMQTKGADTTNSERILLSARMALERRQYDQCMKFCEQARHELTNPTYRPPPAVPTAQQPQEEDASGLEAVAQSILRSEAPSAGPDLYSGTRLSVDKDGSYLSAKFEINTAKIDLKEATDRGADTSEAQTLLTDAEGAFVAGNYAKALSLALKARRAIGPEFEQDAIPLKRAADEEEESEPAPEEHSGLPSRRCVKCSTVLEPGDTFCGTCGAKVMMERVCENCGAKSRSSDKFCRKCGASLV